MDPDVIAVSGRRANRPYEGRTRTPNTLRRDLEKDGTEAVSSRLIEKGQATTKSVSTEEQVERWVNSEKRQKLSDLKLVLDLQERPRNRQIWNYIGERANEWTQALESHLQNPSQELPDFVGENEDFMKELKKVRTEQEYCKLIEKVGKDYLMTTQQMKSLGEEFHLENTELLQEIISSLIAELIRITT